MHLSHSFIASSSLIKLSVYSNMFECFYYFLPDPLWKSHGDSCTTFITFPSLFLKYGLYITAKSNRSIMITTNLLSKQYNIQPGTISLITTKIKTYLKKVLKISIFQLCDRENWFTRIFNCTALVIVNYT